MELHNVNVHLSIPPPSDITNTIQDTCYRNRSSPLWLMGVNYSTLKYGNINLSWIMENPLGKCIHIMTLLDLHAHVHVHVLMNLQVHVCTFLLIIIYIYNILFLFVFII